MHIILWNLLLLLPAFVFSVATVFVYVLMMITQLSSRLKTNRTYISKLINYEFNVTFSDFVNRFRIKEVKKLLAEHYPDNYSLNYISEAAGFGSLGTFIRIFKKSTGMTPGKFHRSI